MLCMFRKSAYHPTEPGSVETRTLVRNVLAIHCLKVFVFLLTEIVVGVLAQ